MHKHISVAAMLAVLAVAGCDRGGDTEAGAKDASAYTRNGPDARAGATPPAGGEPAPPPRQTLATAAPERDTLSDTVITGKIKAAILTDPGMTGADVTVNTDKGAVMLTGTVRSTEQTAIASAHAQRQDGVLRVDNELSVAPQ